MSHRNPGGFILALDQGTTSSRAVVFDAQGVPVSVGQRDLPSSFPQPGWVEQDPGLILSTQLAAAHDALAGASLSASDIAAIGVTNQRETTLVWDRATGRPIHNAIVWQCRRTAAMCHEIRDQGLEHSVRERTGLVIDPYFSATKLSWILDNVPDARGRAERGGLAFGTVDSWLIYQLTDGAHITDPSNASRTMLFDIRRLCWDDELLSALRIPSSLLPEVVPSSGALVHTAVEAFGARVPIAGIAGDQQAALLGQACLTPGMVKNTYGTGCFMLMHTGGQPSISDHGLLTTIAWQIGDRVDYALEGSVFIAGSVVKWLRDQLGLIDSAGESAELAASVQDTQGAYFVPAFAGLGAPYWDPDARGAIVGLTQGVDRRHIVRAALESVAYQSADVLEAMHADTGLSAPEIRADGGAAANDFLMQFQADILGVPVARPRHIETTAAGVAYLAGLGIGLYPDPGRIASQWTLDRRFSPSISFEKRGDLRDGWRQAVGRVLARPR